ncbi:Uncharacterized protein TCM_013016 [Theobroma cacao]|uniref:Uncharacterized protein n=1 Tax=Theobroma cacao TaxID=3641 RepID=A0A061FWK4_THECC|nr:Uncharacterized protein TCM_013016 [Theobroma cacao]
MPTPPSIQYAALMQSVKETQLMLVLFPIPSSNFQKKLKNLINIMTSSHRVLFNIMTSFSRCCFIWSPSPSLRCHICQFLLFPCHLSLLFNLSRFVLFLCKLSLSLTLIR